MHLPSSCMCTSGWTRRIVAFLGLGLWAVVVVQAQSYSPAQVLHFSADSSAHGAKLGWSMAVAGDWLVSGSPHHDSQNGRVTAFQLGALPELPAPVHARDVLGNPQGTTPLQQRFGASLAFSGEWLVVGNCSPFGTSQYCNTTANRVLVYRLDDGEPQAYAVIQAPLGVTGGAFGKAMALEGDVLAIGGARTGTGSNERDVVHLYRLVSGLWQLRDSLFGDGNEAGADEGFGHALALKDGVLAVGASGDDELGADCGAVHLFGRDQGGQDEWGLIRKLLPGNGMAGDRFGVAVALRDGRCAVGAPKRKVNGITTGSAYVFDRDAGLADNWGEVALLEPLGELIGGMDHGASIAIGPDRVAVGAPLHDLQVQDEGSVHVYRVEGTTWSGMQRITPHADQVIGPVGRAGTSLAFHGDRLLIGAPFAIVNGLTPPAVIPSGAVLVYADGPVTVAEVDNGKLQLWPNPVQDQLWIASAPPTPGRAQILDAQGRLIKDLGPLNNGGGSWDLLTLAQGHYLLVVAQEDGARIVRPFVKQ